MCLCMYIHNLISLELCYQEFNHRFTFISYYINSVSLSSIFFFFFSFFLIWIFLCFYYTDCHGRHRIAVDFFFFQPVILIFINLSPFI